MHESYSKNTTRASRVRTMFQSTIVPIEHGLPSETAVHVSSSQFMVSVSISSSLRIPSLSTSVYLGSYQDSVSSCSKYNVKNSHSIESMFALFQVLRTQATFLVNVPCYIFTTSFYQWSVILFPCLRASSISKPCHCLIVSWSFIFSLWPLNLIREFINI